MANETVKVAKVANRIENASYSSPINTLLAALLAGSLAINVALLLRQNSTIVTSLQNPQDHPGSFKALNRVRMDLHTRKEHLQMAKQAFDAASRFSGGRGEGRQGWLTLLKAWDYDRQDEFVGENLMNNYKKLDGYLPIGYTELMAANWTRSKMKKVMGSEQELDKVATQIETSMKQWKLLSRLDPGPGCTTLSFATAFGKWDLNSVLKDVAKLNKDIYSASVNAYLQIKQEFPKMNPTDLNHQLWKLQRSVLDRETQSYWGGFQEIEGFRDLVAAMRHAARRFLGDTHGLDPDDADRKASHPLVVWVSVHTMESVHQPHVTLDALVGGVYYVNVPKNSGRLELYDPRGKSPLDLKEPEAPSNPPFHRTVGIQPSAGMLVLFPGWLVHSVLPSSMDSSKEGYRVSISLNLKGEWQTTGSLSVGCATYL